MLVVGLTGGIGCGKTTVSDIFQKDFNVPVIDADAITRQLTETREVTELLYKNFGDEYFDKNRTLLRDRLRQAIFSDSGIRNMLEDILHPLVYQEIKRKLSLLDAVYCIIVIPLLLETKRTGLTDRILVVDCTIEQQMQRVMLRDKCSKTHVKAIISVQISRDKRLRLANDSIKNYYSMEFLKKKVAILHNQYSTLGETL